MSYPAVVADCRAIHRRLQPGAAVGLLASACLALRSRQIACTACIESCPQHALQMTADGPQLQGDCCGCGRCQVACRSGALNVAGFAVATLPPQSPNAPLRLECRKVPARLSGEALRLPCLAGLSVERLVALQAQANRPLHCIDRGWCANCSLWNKAGHPLAAILDQAIGLLQATGLPAESSPRLLHEPLPPTLMPTELPRIDAGPAVSRRAFFGQLAGQIARSVEPPVAGKQRLADTALPLRRLLVDALTLLIERHGGDWPAGVWFGLQLSQHCDQQQACIGHCPTSALRLQRDESGSALRFDPQRCNGCGLCVRACAQGALSLQPATATTATVLLGHFPVRSCGRCGADLAPSASQNVLLCARCQTSRSLAASAFQQLFGAGACAPLS